MKKPYRNCVTILQIMEDGWSRGFYPEQTVDEATAMGYSTTIEEVREVWNRLTEQMEDHLKDEMEHHHRMLEE